LTTDAVTTHDGPPETRAQDAATGGLAFEAGAAGAPTLGSLPVGARLILRCRADWRAATVAAFDAATARVVLNVASPTGHTYRVRRPADAPLAHDGHFPVLGEGQWRAGLARYDVRW
jgi:7-keto-8-aminopelargonate synthetase-like enzyme